MDPIPWIKVDTEPLLPARLVNQIEDRLTKMKNSHPSFKSEKYHELTYFPFQINYCHVTNSLQNRSNYDARIKPCSIDWLFGEGSRKQVHSHREEGHPIQCCHQQS